MSSILGARDLTNFDLLESGYDIIFSGGHKNFGTSGLTFLIIKEDVMDRCRSNMENQKVPVPMLMDWRSYDNMGDTYFANTPGVTAIYLAHLVCDHMIKMGGIKHYEDLAVARANLFYDCLDASEAKLKDGA